LGGRLKTFFAHFSRTGFADIPKWKIEGWVWLTRRQPIEKRATRVAIPGPQFTVNDAIYGTKGVEAAI